MNPTLKPNQFGWVSDTCLTLGSPFFLKSWSFMQVLYLEFYLKIYCFGTQLWSFTISTTVLRAMQPCPLPSLHPLYRNANVYKFPMLSQVLLVSFFRPSLKPVLPLIARPWFAHFSFSLPLSWTTTEVPASHLTKAVGVKV